MESFESPVGGHGTNGRFPQCRLARELCYFIQQKIGNTADGRCYEIHRAFHRCEYLLSSILRPHGNRVKGDELTCER